ncbi:MAG: class I SAM-dependent methyltransferase [Patescibacteria group bacterium]
MLLANPSKLWRGIEIALLKQNWGRYFKGKILDLGCGEGEIAKEVFDKKIAWGLDKDKKMISQAKNSGVYNQVLREDARKISLATGAADLVFSNSAIEHIQDIDQVLKEVGRVLKPGGFFIATMPSDQLGEYLGWGKLYAQWFNHKYNHYNLFNLSEWQKKLTKSGLKLVDSYYYLDKATIKEWHKLLWLNKLGLKLKIKPVRPEKLEIGAALAILAKKI